MFPSSSLLPLSPSSFGSPKKNGRFSNGLTDFTFAVSVTSTSTTAGRTPLLIERKVLCIASTTPSESAGIETAGVVSAKATFAEPLFALHEKESSPKEIAATVPMPIAFFVYDFIIIYHASRLYLCVSGLYPLVLSVNIMYFGQKCYNFASFSYTKKMLF